MDAFFKITGCALIMVSGVCLDVITGAPAFFAYCALGLCGAWVAFCEGVKKEARW
jgi:hypothetical protein